MFSFLRLNKLLNKQWSYPRFEMPWRSWDVILMTTILTYTPANAFIFISGPCIEIPFFSNEYWLCNSHWVVNFIQRPRGILLHFKLSSVDVIYILTWYITTSVYNRLCVYACKTRDNRLLGMPLRHRPRQLYSYQLYTTLNIWRSCQ